MVETAPGDPLRLVHQEILEEEHTRLDHAHDVLPKCCSIMEIIQACIDKGTFPDGFEAREVIDAIMTEERETLMY